MAAASDVYKRQVEEPDEIIRDTEHGVYVAQLGGGQVNTATGDFVFGMTEAYMIEDGVLTDYMWDFLRARKEGRPQSGNGRRQSYQHLPMVRMTNTFVLNGVPDLSLIHI